MIPSGYSPTNSTRPPQTPTPIERENELPRGLVYSLIAHAGLVILVMTKTLIFPGDPKPLIPTLRVDLVGLPDQLKGEKGSTPLPISPEMTEALKQAENAAREIKPKLPPAPPEQSALTEVPKKDEMLVKPTLAAPPTTPLNAKQRQKKMSSAVQRLKALEGIRSELSDSSQTAQSKTLLKGNQISKGNSASGEFTENPESGYLESLRDRLADHWELPVWLSRQKLSAQTRVWIDRRGKLIRFEFQKTSGNTQFDEAVKRTIVASQPLPAPPRELSSQLENAGVLVGFPL